MAVGSLLKCRINSFIASKTPPDFYAGPRQACPPSREPLRRGGRAEKAYVEMEDSPLGLFCEEYQGKAVIE